MPQYNSFLLRIWRSVGVDGPQWTGRLEHLQQAETLHFSNLDALLAHLRVVGGGLEGTAPAMPDPVSTPPPTLVAEQVSAPPAVAPPPEAKSPDLGCPPSVAS